MSTNICCSPGSLPSPPPPCVSSNPKIQPRGSPAKGLRRLVQKLWHSQELLWSAWRGLRGQVVCGQGVEARRGYKKENVPPVVPMGCAHRSVAVMQMSIGFWHGHLTPVLPRSTFVMGMSSR